jgi:hypothetical protein
MAKNTAFQKEQEKQLQLVPNLIFICSPLRIKKLYVLGALMVEEHQVNT